MLHTDNANVRKYLLKGNFGLEKESLRVYGDGSFAMSPHPFPDDAHIVKDFCENQTEINTGVHESAEGAIEELCLHEARIQKKLSLLRPREYLWPFSNPPHIRNEDDIPIAVFRGEQAAKGEYRKYLSDKYGRYKMTFSGIHVNFSFADELLLSDYECQRRKQAELTFREYKDGFYLELARGLVEAAWILVAATAASPVMDASFLEKNVYDRDAFTGMGSVRCSELGYWNEFAPVMDYSGVKAYVRSIRDYVQKGIIKAPSELYFPVRIKPVGENSLESLEKNGISHIELRMYDLNPLCDAGVDVRDVRFAQLLALWIIGTPPHPFSESTQVHAVQNFKNAAHYDLKTVRMITPDGANTSIADAAQLMIGEMKDFFADIAPQVMDILDFELSKFTNADNRYAWKVRKRYGEGFAKKALALAKEKQERVLV